MRSRNDRALCVLPIYHINGLCVTVMGTLVSASTLVMLLVFGLDLLGNDCAIRLQLVFSRSHTICLYPEQ